MRKQKITILLQTHPDLVMLKTETKQRALQIPELWEKFKSVARSQCNIAQHISEKIKVNPNIVVIFESFPGMKYGDMPDHLKIINNVFSNGIPDDCNALSDLQITYLAHYCASRSLVNLGIKKVLPSTYKSFNHFFTIFQKHYRKLNSYMPGTQYFTERYIIDKKREFLTLCNAVSKKEETIIVFGANHKFTDLKNCLPTPIEIEIVDYSEEIPGVLRTRFRKRGRTNCTELRNLANKAGYKELFDVSTTGKHQETTLGKTSSTAVKKQSHEALATGYNVSLMDCSKTIGKSFLYAAFPNLFNIYIRDAFCTPIQANFISEVIKVTSMYFDLGLVSLISPVINGFLLTLTSLSYEQASVINNILIFIAKAIFNTKATLLLPELSTRFFYKIAATFICSVIGSLIGRLMVYAVLKYIKPTARYTQSKKPQLTNKDIKQVFKQPKLRHYCFDKESRKTIHRFFRGKQKKNWPLDKVAGLIYKTSHYSSKFGFFRDAFSCCGKTKLYIQGKTLENASGIKIKYK